MGRFIDVIRMNGTFVEYHGSLSEFRGKTFEVLAHNLNTDRFTLKEVDVFCPPEALAVLTQVRRESFTIKSTTNKVLADQLGL